MLGEQLRDPLDSLDILPVQPPDVEGFRANPLTEEERKEIQARMRILIESIK